mgnify:CR=1 FL=1
MSEYKDYIVRATAADHQLRAFAVTSRDIVEKAREIHNTSPVATAAIGRLLTAASMMGSMMKGEKDVLTLQIECCRVNNSAESRCIVGRYRMQKYYGSGVQP